MAGLIFAWIRLRWPWLLAAGGVGFVAWFLAQGLTLEAQAEKRKERFREALEEKNVGKAMAMVSAEYRDQWGYGPEEVGRVFRDVTAQFLTLRVTFSDEKFERRGREIVFTARVRLDGQPLTPIGSMMSSYAAEQREPFVMTWRKEGWWPWTWRLGHVANAGLEPPADYRPGMFSENAGSLEGLIDRAIAPPPQRNSPSNSKAPDGSR